MALDLLQPSLELKRAPEKKSLLHVPVDDKVQMQMVIFFFQMKMTKVVCRKKVLMKIWPALQFERLTCRLTLNYRDDLTWIVIKCPHATLKDIGRDIYSTALN